MKKLWLSTMLSLMLLVALAGAALAATGDVTDSQALKELAAVKKATAKYHDVNLAVADGYVPDPHCAMSPGEGGMGYHYINFGLVAQPGVELTRPEVLLYADSGKGLKLVGVEYFVPLESLEPLNPEPALFGQVFDGPMAGHADGMPPHYDLHAWVWLANPNGTFAGYNPLVTCP